MTRVDVPTNFRLPGGCLVLVILLGRNDKRQSPALLAW